MPSAPRGIEHHLWPSAAVEPLRLRRAPLLAAALCFATGILLARHWQPPSLLLLAVALLVLLTLAGLRHRARPATVAVAGLWIATGLWCAEIQPAPSTQPALLSYADGLSRTVRGHVVRIRRLPSPAPERDTDADPTLWIERDPPPDPAARLLSVDLAVTAVESLTPDTSTLVPVEGGIRVTLAGYTAPLACGDTLEAPLRLKLPARYRDPGAWQYADYLLGQGIAATAGAKVAQVVRVATPPPGAWTRPALQCRLYAAQAWASARLLDYTRARPNRLLPPVFRLDGADAAMLDAMLFGDRTRLTRTLRLGFERTGSFHLFVVSGMHVALLAGGVFWLCRRLRIGVWPATLLTLALTAAYALLTGFGAPIQRAFGMTAVFLVARLLGRQRAVLNTLGAAALAVLAWSPGALFEAGFQMTFLVIVAIAGIAVPLGERTFLPVAHAARRLRDPRLDAALPPRLAQTRVMLRLWAGRLAALLGPRAWPLPAAALRAILWTAELALVGIVAELLMILPMAVYFHRATVFALPANMLSIPLVAVLAPIAVLTFLAALLSPWLALVPGALTALLLHGTAGIIGHVGRLHAADTRIPAPAVALIVVALAGWAFCCWAVRRSPRWAICAAALLPALAAMLLWPEPPRRTPGTLEVTAIDVGQGDSLLLVSPTGRTLLVDAGGPVGAVQETAEATSRFDIGEQVVSPYLWSRRIRRLDVLVLSHAHSDHMGGMAAVMRSFRPRELWVSTDPGSPAYAALLAEAATLGVAVRHLHADDTPPWGDTPVRVLAPEPDYRNGFNPANNDSLVLQVDCGKASVLLEGDAEAAGERAMLLHHRLNPVTLLKVGHHGSRTSSTEDFLAATAPRAAVISVGRGNTFGHPRPEVVARFAAAHTRLYRTDEFGLVTFLLRPDGTVQPVTAPAEAPALP